MLTGDDAPAGVGAMVKDAGSAPAPQRAKGRPYYVNGREVVREVFEEAVRRSGQYRPGAFPASRSINLKEQEGNG